MLKAVKKNPPDTDKEVTIKNARDVCLEKMRLNRNQSCVNEMKVHWSEVVRWESSYSHGSEEQN